MEKIPVDNGKPQEDLELLKKAFIVWVVNGTGPPVQATIEVLGSEKSTVKILKGGYHVVKTSKIRIKCPD